MVKLISFISTLYTGFILALTAINPNDVFFLAMSNNQQSISIRLGISLLLLIFTYIHIKNIFINFILTIGGMITFGISFYGLIFSPSDYLSPIDAIGMLTVGLGFLILSLENTYPPQEEIKTRLSTTKQSKLALKGAPPKTKPRYAYGFSRSKSQRAMPF